MSKWSHEQDTILRDMYWDAPMEQIIASAGRTLNAIYVRAKVLGLKRKHNGGFRIGNTIRNRKRAAPKPPGIQDRILTLLRDTDAAWVARDVAKALASDLAAISFALRCLHRVGSIHIEEFRPKRLKHDPPFVPAYSIGDCDDAPMPEPEEVERFYAPNPVPRPELHPWVARAFANQIQEISE